MDERGDKVNVKDRAELDKMEDNPEEEDNPPGIACHHQHNSLKGKGAAGVRRQTRRKTCKLGAPWEGTRKKRDFGKVAVAGNKFEENAPSNSKFGSTERLL
jgi:hypothetical protein